MVARLRPPPHCQRRLTRNASAYRKRNGLRVDTTVAILIQRVGDVLAEVGQPSLMVGSREGEAQRAAGT
jgi:hypothetical protein